MIRLLILAACAAFLLGLALPPNGGLLLSGAALVVILAVPASRREVGR